MENTLIDHLNKILTNILEYRELLNDLANKVTDETTQKKLAELAEVKVKQSEELIKLISLLGGDVESTERMTDQKSISWIEQPIPDAGDMDAILAVLIQAEQNAQKTYQETIRNNDMKSKIRIELESHLQESESNLNYFEVAKGSR